MGSVHEHYTPVLGFGWLIIRPESWLAPHPKQTISGSKCSVARIVSSVLTHAVNWLTATFHYVTFGAMDRTQ
jgi:hypothetical protein